MFYLWEILITCMHTCIFTKKSMHIASMLVTQLKSSQQSIKKSTHCGERWDLYLKLVFKICVLKGTCMRWGKEYGRNGRNATIFWFKYLNTRLPCALTRRKNPNLLRCYNWTVIPLTTSKLLVVSTLLAFLLLIFYYIPVSNLSLLSLVKILQFFTLISLFIF